MNFLYNIKWMFLGSIIIGVFLNAMNILAYRFSDLYISRTLIYSALFMASNMCLLEVFMYYSHSNNFKTNYFIFFTLLSVIVAYLLKEQVFIDDNEWLKRMISHHSTALTTSHKISKRTNNKEIKKLADEIIVVQENEIKLMKSLLQ